MMSVLIVGVCMISIDLLFPIATYRCLPVVHPVHLLPRQPGCSVTEYQRQRSGQVHHVHEGDVAGDHDRHVLHAACSAAHAHLLEEEDRARRGAYQGS